MCSVFPAARQYSGTPVFGPPDERPPLFCNLTVFAPGGLVLFFKVPLMSRALLTRPTGSKFVKFMPQTGFISQKNYPLKWLQEQFWSVSVFRNYQNRSFVELNAHLWKPMNLIGVIDSNQTKQKLRNNHSAQRKVKREFNNIRWLHQEKVSINQNGVEINNKKDLYGYHYGSRQCSPN